MVDCASNLWSKEKLQSYANEVLANQQADSCDITRNNFLTLLKTQARTEIFS